MKIYKRVTQPSLLMSGFIALALSILFNILVSWGRMFAALGVSILISISAGIYIARHRLAEHIAIPIIDILQTLPILAFFPAAIALFVVGLPGAIGVNAAIVFLIITSMLWNIILAVYESVKLLPQEYLEMARLNGMSNWDILTRVYVPASLPGVAQQSALSWAIGLFYLVTSEIFSTGAGFCTIHACAARYGIGVLITKLAFSGNTLGYISAILLFILAVVITTFLFFIPLDRRLNRQHAHSGAAGPLERLLRSMQPFRGLTTRMRAAQHHAHQSGAVRRKAGQATPRPSARRSGLRYYTALICSAAALLSAIAIYRSSAGRKMLALLGRYEYVALLNLAASFIRVWGAFAVVVMVGVPISIYLVFISRRTSAYMLLFQVMASIPATIVLPGLALVLALANLNKGGNLLAFIIYFISGIWYVIFGIVAGTKGLGNDVAEVKKVYGVRGVKAWGSIYIGAIMPGFITGAITGIAAEWNASIVAEYFTSAGITTTARCAAAAASGCARIASSVGYGIGKLLDTSISTNNNLLLAVALINMTAMIIIVNTFLWKRMYRKVASMR